jgi:hypothetical protein
MTTGEDTLERRCEGHAMSSSSECPRVDAMARYEWTSVWIVNEVAMMSMKISVGLTFMDIASMLKLNELEDICLGQ